MGNLPSLPGHPVQIDISPHPSQRSKEELLTERRETARVLGEFMLDNRHLRDALYVDARTGVGSLFAFEEDYKKAIELAEANNEPMALLVADTDGLSRANALPGRHETGNLLLQKTVEGLEGSLRPSDKLYREGGDEFTAILPGFTPMPGQSEAELLDEVNKRFSLSTQSSIGELPFADKIKAGVSFGIAIRRPGESGKDLKKRADEIAMANKEARMAELKAQGIVFQDRRKLAS